MESATERDVSGLVRARPWQEGFFISSPGALVLHGISMELRRKGENTDFKMEFSRMSGSSAAERFSKSTRDHGHSHSQHSTSKLQG